MAVQRSGEGKVKKHFVWAKGKTGSDFHLSTEASWNMGWRQPFWSLHVRKINLERGNWTKQAPGLSQNSERILEATKDRGERTSSVSADGPRLLHAVMRFGGRHVRRLWKEIFMKLSQKPTRGEKKQNKPSVTEQFLLISVITIHGSMKSRSFRELKPFFCHREEKKQNKKKNLKHVFMTTHCTACFYDALVGGGGGTPPAAPGVGG